MCELDSILSRKPGFLFDTQMQMDLWSGFTCVSLSHSERGKKTSPFPVVLTLFIYPLSSLPPLYSWLKLRSLFNSTTDESLHAQQKKILTIFFLLCSQFIFDRFLLHFAHVQWIIKGSVKILPACEAGSAVPYTFFLTCNCNANDTFMTHVCIHSWPDFIFLYSLQCTVSTAIWAAMQRSRFEPDSSKVGLTNCRNSSLCLKWLMTQSKEVKRRIFFSSILRTIISWSI